ncbi:MAG TPA: ParB N-terminal domain-containing protein, partial [Myxococcaceae bacterium]|nr:ParB N-terminal domain-containing protein [Myxococcaceae bacterium]
EADAQSEHPTEVTAPPPDGPAASPRPPPSQIPIERIDEDSTFQLRPCGDLSPLATDLARLGQLFPIDVRVKGPDRFQVISGFRRLAALKFLQRDRVLAHVHPELSDADALLMALASVIHAAPISRDDLTLLRDRLEHEGRLSSAARDMLDKALTEDPTLAPETVEEEVDADELADDVTARLGVINQDLALLVDVFASLDDARREELLRQLRYSADLVTYLEGG